MKKYFEYIGLLTFALCSFYYTNKVTKIMNAKDPVMIEIKKYNEKNKTNCKEGYIKNNEVVLGSSGKEVNIEMSYSNMQGKEFDESKLVFNELTCKINVESAKDNYIIKGNESKNMISLLIKVNDTSLLNEILEIGKQSNISLGIITDGNILEKNKEYFEKTLKNGNYIVNDGNNFNTYYNFMNEVKMNKYCIETSSNDNLNDCKKGKVILLRTNEIYRSNILLNVKTDLEKGKFYVLSENNITLKELNALIKVINAKGISTVSLDKLFN